MKKLTFLSNLWRLFRGSQKDDGSSRLRVDYDSFTCRLRVCPLKLVSVFAILLTIGVGNVWGAEGDKAYTLDFTAKTANHASYTDTWTYGDFSIYAGGNNNYQNEWLWVRFGGKGGSKTSSVSTINSTITATKAITSKVVKKVTVYYTQVTNSNYTANKCTLEVASNSDFSTMVDTRIIDSPVKSSGTTFDFTPNTVTVWPASAYYRITIGATIKGKSNMGVDVSKIEFIEGASGGGCANQVNITNSSTTSVSHGSFDVDKTGSQDACSALSVTVTPNPDDHYHVASVSATNPATTGTAGAAVDNGDGTYTITYSANAKGNSTISVTFAEDDHYTVTWMKNGSQHTTTEVYSGEKPTFPSTPLSCDGTSTTFIGWTKTTWTGKQNQTYVDGLTTDATKVHTSNSTMSNITANGTVYHAVFAKAGAGGNGNIQLSYTSLSLTTSYESASTKAVSDVDFYCNDIMTGNSGSDGYQKIQFKKSSTGPGYIYNSEILPGNITSIVFGSTTRDMTVNFGDSSNPDGSAETTTCSSSSLTATPTGNYKYFKIINSVDYAAYTGTITINYSNVSYSDYLTTCCSELGAIGGTVTFNSPVEAKIKWDKISNVSSWTLKYKVHGAGAWSTAYTSKTSSDSEISESDDDSNGVNDHLYSTIAVNCNTAYDFLIIANPASGYCDKEEELNNSGSGYNSGKWSVSYTLTDSKATKESGPAAGANVCGDFDATFEAVDGYHLPDDVTVTIGGVAQTKGTGYTWSVTAGVGTLEIDGGDIDGAIAITVTAIETTCSDWGFYYGTDGKSDWAYTCFSQVGSTHEWKTGTFTIPNKPNWYVDNASGNDGKKVLTTWASLYFVASQGDGSRPMVGAATGATGKIRIYDNSDWNNRYAGFIPDGYKLKFGTDYSPFTLSSGNTYYSDIVTYNSTNASRNVAVGIINANSSNAYVSTDNTQDMRHVFLNTGGTDYWEASSVNTFGLYDITNTRFTCLMVAVPGESNLYEGWVPSNCTSIIFVRLKSSTLAWGDANANVHNQTVDISLESSKSIYTIDTWNYNSTGKSSGTWSAYTRSGKFRIDDNYTDKNWYVRFLPHYILSYDANGGSGAPADQAVALNASPCQLTVSTTAPTRTGYTFLGWNEDDEATEADGDWDGGDTHAMTADVTLYAVWQAKTISLTLDKNNSDASGSSNGSGTIKYDATAKTSITAATRTGYDVEGYYSENTCAAANKVLTNAGAVVNSTVSGYTSSGKWARETTPTTLYTKWTAHTTAITLNTQSATTDGTTSVTATYGQNTNLSSAITKPTKTGYSFGGYFTNVSGGGTQLIGSDGNWIASVDDYTDASKNWQLDEGTLTLYAYWIAVKDFTLVTSSTTLEEGDEVIITNTTPDYALSTTQETKYRARTSVSESSTNIISIASGSLIQVIELEPEGSNWMLKVGTNQYLYAAGTGTSNLLKTDNKSTVGDKGKWRITVNASNEAKIAAQGTNADSIIRYNSNSGTERFSCYSTGQNAIKLYYYRRTDPYITTTSDDLTTFTYAVGYGPSLAQALTIKGYNLTGSLTVACPSGYELSSTSATSGFGTSNLTLTKDAKNKVNATVYIRLAAGKSADSYNQTLAISGGGITSENISLSGSVVAVPASSTTYCLITNKDDIFPDDEIVIMSSSGDRLLGAQAKNNRMATTPGNGDHFALLGPAVFTKNASDSIQNIVVEGCDDAWMFKVGDNSYLYSAGASSNNYLKSAALATAGDNGRWKIQVNTNLDDTIRSIGSAERNTMWYNASNNIFSSYATIQTELPRIYAKPSATANVCGSPLALSGFETTYGTASSAQTISVKARNISTGNVTVAAPSGYEVCMTANGTYTSSVTITPTAGAVSATTVYVRLSASSNRGTYNADSLTISATDATTRKIALSGEISCADPGLATSDDTWDVELSGSSVVISNVVSSTSSSGTITATFDPSGDTDGLVYNQAANTFTMTKTGIWEITLTQAANGNYCEDAVTCMVSVTCGTPTAPTGLEASEISYNQATISWDAVDGADHYDVIVSGKTSGGDESYMESYENITSTSTTVTGLKGGCTYEYYVSVTNTCEETNESDIEEFTTQYYVAYHSATEDDYVISIASGGSVAARGTDDCDNGKVFVGWTTSAVAALQQSDPTTNTTGAIASVTANTDLYAVFASQNGYTTATILDEKWGVVDWDGTNKIVGGSYSSWATNFADAPSTSFKISSTTYQAIVFDVSSARTLTSETVYSNLKKVQITGSNRSSFAMDVTVKVSTDKSSWITVATKSLGAASNTTPQTLEYTLDVKGNYYVRIETQAKSSGNKTGITNIRLYQGQDYYLTDYSTNCTKASSPAAITWENVGGSLADGTQPTSATIGSDITMPTLTKADYRFDGWKATINSVAKTEVFTGGDKFTVNHPVTFTAQWTQVFSVTSPTEKLTSYKDVKVTSTTQTFSTVGMHNAVPSVTVTDDTRFTMTINSHEANGGNEDYSYTFSYQPNAFGTGSGAATNTTTATVTDARTGVVSSAITLSGRSLPEEFVIAVKKGDQWVALPNNLASTSAQPSIVPQVITVDNTTTPTAAVYAPSTTVYKATGRNNAAKYVRGIRFTTTGSNWLQTAKADGTYNMWLSESNSDSAQVWYLSSSDYGAYTLKMDTKHNGSKKMGIYTGGYMGFHGDPSSSDIYLLPITNKYTEIPATVHEWGVHGVVVQPSTPADLTGVTSASMHIDGASPSDATATAVNVAMGTAKYVRVYAAGATVGAVANEGKQLYVHWKNGESEVGASQIEIPYVVAESNNMATLSASKTTWPNREVHVLPGVTLTANTGSYSPKDATIKELHIYPGATVDVTTGTLIATTLRLHNGWTRADEKQYNVARVHIADDAALQKTTASMDYDIYEKSDGKHYYPLAVPFRTLVSTINYADAALASAATYGKHFGIDKYDGANRAENGATDENWVQMTTSEYLEPGKGYTITAVSSKGSAIIRVPLDFANTWTADGEKATIDESYYKNQVAVTAYTGTASTGGGENNRNAGWNILGVPYMSCFDASDASASPSDAFTKGKLNFITGEYTETNNVYVNVPVHDFSEYIQKPVSEAKLLPGWCFFVQFGKNGTLSFAVDGQEQSSSLPIYAPKRDEMQEVKTGIILSNGDKSDQTTLLISDKYSADEYEINADLEKMFGNGYTLATYSLSRNTRLAYNAMSTTDAKNVIPIGFRAPEDGEYTFSLNPRYAEAAVERVDLIDYQTGEVTNLMMSDYTFKTGRTQDDERFALNVVSMANMPTGVEENSQKSKVESRKLIIDDHVYIIRNGLMYDATGKRVDVINK